MEYIKKDVKIFVLSGKAKSGKNEESKIIENYYKKENKKVIITGFTYYLKDYAKRITGWAGDEESKPREFLQQFGIEFIKEKIDDKLFINRTLQDILIFSYFYDIIIISDARLIDEIEILKSKYSNVVTIKVIRDGFDNGLSVSEKNHITETALDNYNNFDYIIKNENYGSLEKDIINLLGSVL